MGRYFAPPPVVVIPTGTGFTHITSGAQDAASKLVDNVDVDAAAAIDTAKIDWTKQITSSSNLTITCSSYMTLTTNGNLFLWGGSTKLFTLSENQVYPGNPGIDINRLFYPYQHATVGAPAWVAGAMYYDTSLGKLRIGGEAAWETVTSA